LKRRNNELGNECKVRPIALILLMDIRMCPSKYTKEIPPGELYLRKKGVPEKSR
jgi:hypothetical protein